MLSKKTTLISVAVVLVMAFNLSDWQIIKVLSNSIGHQPVETQVNQLVSAEYHPENSLTDIHLCSVLAAQADVSPLRGYCDPTPMPPTPIPPPPQEPLVTLDEPQKPLLPPRPCAVDDGRANINDCAAPIAVYCQDAGFDIYVISTWDGHGSLLTTVSADEIARVGVSKDANAVIKVVNGVMISRLTTGEFQINAVQSDGKPYIFIWDGCGPVSVVQSVPPTGLVCEDCLLYHSMITGDWDIWRLGDWPGVELGDPNISRGLGARDVAPSRSPDNNWVVFASDRDGRWEIYRSAVSGAQIERLTDDPDDADVDPVWSPRGDYVVFEHDRNGNWDLALLDLNIRTETPLAATWRRCERGLVTRRPEAAVPERL